jgi:hypothetical protein
VRVFGCMIRPLRACWAFLRAAQGLDMPGSRQVRENNFRMGNAGKNHLGLGITQAVPFGFLPFWQLGVGMPVWL